MQLSVVIPLFNEQESLVPLTEWLDKALTKAAIDYEILFIDDGSTDGSWECVTGLRARYGARVRAYGFYTNQGKAAALACGFRHAQAPVVITMDADLQDSPDELPSLYERIATQGLDLVSGWKQQRKDSWLKNATSRLFNTVTRYVSGIKLHDFNCGLKAYRLEVARSLRLQGDMHRYIPLMVKWNGFTRIAEQRVVHYPRRHGRSKYGLERFLYGFLDLLSIVFVTRFVERPMHFFGLLGSLCFMVGVLTSVYLVLEKMYLLSHNQVARDVVEQPLFYFALTAVVIGVQLFLSGFLAEMITRSSPRPTTDDIVKRTL